MLDSKHLNSNLKRNTYSTTFGCLSPLSNEISLMAVDGTPSTSFSSLIFFSATYYTLESVKGEEIAQTQKSQTFEMEGAVPLHVKAELPDFFT